MMRKINNLTQTALCLALLICIQYVTKPFGQFVTGSCVNMILAMTAVLCGAKESVFVAFVSPFFAFMLGIGSSYFQIVFCIAISNCVYVLFINLSFKRAKERNVYILISGMIAAILKFVSIYILVVLLVIPALKLEKEVFSKMAIMFSWPQLVTACIGTGLMLITIRPIKNALKRN